MTTDELIKHYGSGYRLAKVLNISPQNVTRWRRNNRVPLRQQMILEELTNGLFKASVEEWVNPTPKGDEQ